MKVDHPLPEGAKSFPIIKPSKDLVIKSLKDLLLFLTPSESKAVQKVIDKLEKEK